jgi:hypothetical protein
MDIKEIVQAWAIALKPTQEQIELAEKRYEICKSCEYIQDNFFGESCNICGCVIKKKIFSPRNPACPLKKW